MCKMLFIKRKEERRGKRGKEKEVKEGGEEKCRQRKKGGEEEGGGRERREGWRGDAALRVLKQM